MNAPRQPDDDARTASLKPLAARPGRWLAIETSGLHGSIAAGEVTADRCVVAASQALPRQARSAQTLTPAIAELLGGLGWQAKDLATICVAAGPGSFTGLRVGVVTAKAMAYALGTPILGVDTLDVLAEGDPPADGDSGLWAILDAQRGELFAARFAATEGRWQREESTQRLTRDSLLDYLRPGDRVVGPAAETLIEHAVCKNAEPQAAAVLPVAWRKWQAGGADNVFALAPEYLRQSAAEEKLESS